MLFRSVSQSRYHEWLLEQNMLRTRKRPLKFNDVDLNGDVRGNSASMFLLNGMATGTADNTRTGRRVAIEGVHIKGWIASNAADNLSNGSNIEPSQLWRAMVLYDKQTSNVGPAVTDVLETSTANSQLNRDNRKRFDVLYDKMWVVGAIIRNNPVVPSGSVMDVASGQVVVDINLDVLLTTTYSGTGSGISNISTGSLHLMLVGTADITLGQLGGRSHLKGRILYRDDDLLYKTTAAHDPITAAPTSQALVVRHEPIHAPTKMATGHYVRITRLHFEFSKEQTRRSSVIRTYIINSDVTLIIISPS